MMTTFRMFLFALVFLLLQSFGLQAQQKGSIVQDTIFSTVLKKNVTGENPARAVSVYLPPGYSETTKRYPVIYLLHGIQDTNETWLTPWTDKNNGYATLDQVMDKGIQTGKFGEMIVVMPDQRTNWFGSFYVNSSATGSWADFTSMELVGFIDAKYRTLPVAESRGIAGHSMGGYGALSLGMKYPDIFSVVYGLNPALIDFYGDLDIDCPCYETVLAASSFDDLIATRDLYTMAVITVAQAFSPNPDKPPFYADLPFKLVDNKLIPNPEPYGKWKAQSLVELVDDYRDKLLQLKGYRFDSGYEDEFLFIPVGSRRLSKELSKNGIPHIFEEYNGDHRNRLWGPMGRMYTDLLPYFWELLKH